MADTVETLEIEIKHRASGAASELKRVTSAIRSMGKATKATKGPLENLISSFKRIAFYRFIRSIIKNITQAFSEGLQKAYIFSSGITGEGNRFAAALDKMKASGNQLKGQLGSAFISLLAAIQPILEAIINLCIRVADAISQLLAAFSGKGLTYLKANNNAMAKYADTMKKGAGAAKEWKNQLLGFDEINRLNEPNSGGGGGGIDPLDGYAFEESPINSKIIAFAQKIRDFFNSLNFEPLKQSLAHLRESFGKLVELIGGAFRWVWENILAPFIKWYTEEYAPVAIELLATAFDTLRIVLEKLQPVFQWIWDNILAPLAEWTGDALIAALEDITGLLQKFNDLMEGKISVHEFFEELSLVQWIMQLLITPLGTVVLLVQDFIDEMRRGVSPIQFIWDKIDLLKQKLEEFCGTLGDTKDKLGETWGDGKLQISDFAYIAIARLQAIINTISTLIGWFQTLHSWIQDALDGFSLIHSYGGSPLSGGGGTFLGGFASGGYPDEGQLFIAREAGPEMVGTIGGRTAVANNQDIVDGIRQGVYDAVMAANMNGNNDVNVKVYLDSKQIKVGQENLARAMG